MIAIAVAAVLLTGVRATPPLQRWREGYLMWQVLRRHRTDVEIAQARWGTGSGAYRRALIDLRVSEMQFARFVPGSFPDRIGSACFGAVCLSAVSVALALPAWCLVVIRRWLVCGSGTRSSAQTQHDAAQHNLRRGIS